MLSQQAFNALLKTLEEPPPHVKFVFATTEAHKVLPTIVSRCQRFEFRSIPAELISGKLREICETEEIEVDDEALATIARMAMGGMRDAQSILDQMISFCGKKISQVDVLEVYGLASADSVKNLSLAIAKADYQSILEAADGFVSQGIDLYRCLLDLQEQIRAGLVRSIRGDKDDLDFSSEQYARVLDSLRAGEDSVRSGLSDQVNFEVTLFRAVEASRSRAIDSVIRDISEIVSEGKTKKKTEQLVEASAPSEPSEDVLSVVEASPVDVRDPSPEKNVEDEPVVADQVQEPSFMPEEAEEIVPSEEEANPSETQPLDQNLIAERVRDLPSSLRKILEEDFGGRFLAVEKIDWDKLI